MFGSAPAFWWGREPGWQARLLGPAGLLYGAVARHRMARSGEAASAPVLCVGNFTAGGAGKTPVAIEVALRLEGRGHRPAFLSRGYGRRGNDADVIAVDRMRHTADEAGDEPLLLARYAPTFVATDRHRGAAAAIKAGATILITDDGLQNPGLVKTAGIVVADAETGIGNGLCMPAGPLRAPMEAQWPLASLLCVVGFGEPGRWLEAQAHSRGVPVIRARIEADPEVQADLLGRRLFAFSGIGRPEKFFRTLETCGLDVVGRRTFGDHHAFGASDRKALLDEARRCGAELVTTEKDRVRLPTGFATHVLPIRLVFEPAAAALDALLDRLAEVGISRA